MQALTFHICAWSFVCSGCCHWCWCSPYETKNHIPDIDEYRNSYCICIVSGDPLVTPLRCSLQGSLLFAVYHQGDSYWWLFKWAVGGGELKARFIIESMRSQICDFFDSSRQNTITLVQTKTHEVYRPQEHANTKQTSFFSVFQPCATIYVTECTVYADKSFAAQACIHMKHV